MAAIPIDGEVFTLANLARLAANRGEAALSEFWKARTEIERTQLMEISRELWTLARPMPDYQNPIDKARSDFANLIYTIETKLSPYDARQVFEKWIEILTPKADKKSGVLIRLFTMRPGPNVSELARQIAKENAATVPPEKQIGWNGTDADTITRSIFRELQIFRRQCGDDSEGV